MTELESSLKLFLFHSLHSHFFHTSTNKHLNIVDYLADVHTVTLREKNPSLLSSLTSPQPFILSSSSSSFSLRGATRNRREPPCHLPLQAFSCLVIYFLHFIAEGRGMSHRIGHLITGEEMLRGGTAASLGAVTECHVLEPQKEKKTEGEKEADVNRRILFAQHKCLWLTAKYLFLYEPNAHREEFTIFFCTERGLEDGDGLCELELLVFGA